MRRHWRLCRKARSAGVPTLAELGFAATNLRELKIPIGMSGAQALLDDFADRMDRYDESRDFPSIKGPSYLSVHLRFGTVSIRQLAALAWQRQQAGSRGAQGWLSELIWRDFYQQSCTTIPRSSATPSSRNTTASSGPMESMPRSISAHGATAARAIRWWTPRCRRSTRPATCTTACEW